jgi:AraC-like DNA-binding protein
MFLTMHELKTSITRLNQLAESPQSTGLSLYVHYWGGETVLYDNHLHKHSFFEVCYVLDGKGIYCEDEIEYPLEPGTLFLSRPHLKHQILSQTGLYIVFVAFEFIESNCSDSVNAAMHQFATTPNIHLMNIDQSPAALIWKGLLAQAAIDNKLLSNCIPDLACGLIAALETAFRSSSETEQKGSPSRESTTIVHRAKLFIRDNLSEPLRLKKVSKYLNISGRHLSRLFAEDLGQTFSAYVQKERIRYASLMLSTTDRTIKQISEEAGFSSVHYFTHVFKLEMGTSPGAFYKKMHGSLK